MDTSHPLRIAWIGRLEQAQKRIHDLPVILQALDQAGVNFHLTMAGDGIERNSIFEALSPWLERNVVSMSGSFSNEDIFAEVYAKHHVLLITSSWETGPIATWEAMAAGMAVVSSRYVGSGMEAALIDGHNALLFPIGDAHAAARGLARLADPGMREPLVRHGMELVQ